MVRSKYVHESNGDRSLFSTRSEVERSKDESAYGRERPPPLPRACVRAGRSRPLGAERRSWTKIETRSAPDLDWIRNESRSALARNVHEVPCVQLDIRAKNIVTKPPSRPGITGITLELQQDHSLCSTVPRTAVPCIPSDYVEVGSWLRDSSIASACVQRFVLT
jgi:hypothetical protein